MKALSIYKSQHKKTSTICLSQNVCLLKIKYTRNRQESLFPVSSAETSQQAQIYSDSLKRQNASCKSTRYRAAIHNDRTDPCWPGSLYLELCWWRGSCEGGPPQPCSENPKGPRTFSRMEQFIRGTLNPMRNLLQPHLPKQSRGESNAA